MPQIFHRSMNTWSKVSIFGPLFCLGFLIWVCYVFARTSYGTDERVIRVQPVPFSHQHHVGILGIDCRYCHTSVEHSSFAGMPPTKTCMNCHSQIWVGSTMLEPVRESWRTGESLRWPRVYNVPGFVYFDHSIHIHKGIGCKSCHGQIDEMPFTYQASSLLMEWCLDCHRHPEKNVRPVKDVFNMRYAVAEARDESGHPYTDENGQPLDTQEKLGPYLVKKNAIKKNAIKDARTLTSCTVCHR